MMGHPASGRDDIRRQDRRAGRPRRHSGRGRRWLAVAGYGGLAVLCLVLGALAFLLVAPPLDRLRDRLVEEVRARTGRTLVVGGPMSVTLFPRVVVLLRDVAILPPEGVDGPATATVPSVEVETSLRSLLSRRPKLDRVTLHQPVIELAIDAQGRRNWDTAASKPRPQAPPAVERDGAAAATPSPPEHLPNTGGATPTTSDPPRPWSVHVIEASVRYRDERSGSRHEIGGLNLDLAAKDHRVGPVTASGTFAWLGEPWRFSGTASHELLKGRPGPVSFKVAGAVEAGFQGTLAAKDGLAADGALSLGTITYKGLKIGPSELLVSISAGVAKVTLRQVELYDGRGEGTFTLDDTGPAPAHALSLKLTGVSMLPLLADGAGIGWVDGRGAVSLDLAGRGRSEQQILETLQGKVQMTVADGAITGIDMDRGLRALQRGRLDRLAPRRQDRTPFSELSGTFDIADGVARNHDLKLASQNVQLSGEGTIELAPRLIDYTLQTKITGGQPEDGAAFKIGSIELPVGIKGPLDKPAFTIKGQEGLTDAIKQIGRNLRSRDVQDALKGFLSGDGEKRAKPADLIDKLLKPQ
jgi:uncharacterized protein involved in outer membrane biogenesis